MAFQYYIYLTIQRIEVYLDKKGYNHGVKSPAHDGEL
jgi:hypothetical protein